jgi:lipopolysaccharide/colanic/teichoic acid biosynthesis glycosyltransferase
MSERVRYDLEYLRNWSPWLDIKILFKTFLVVLHDRRNAY